MRNSKGWDGKQRVDRNVLVMNPEALEDAEYSDSDGAPPEEIEADEGREIYLTVIFWWSDYHRFAR